MKKTNTIVILLIVGIALLLTDLFTGIWYWNRLNLRFDSMNFNNIVTPLFTIIATIIYSLALFTTINQNKIITSQNLKPHYEKEIENLILKAQNKINIQGEITDLDEPQKINALNCIQSINDGIIKLSKNSEYREDYNSYEKGLILNKEYFEKRNYYGLLLFLTQFSIGLNPISFFYEDVKSLIQEINLSKLISDDKELLKKRLRREFLNEYIALIKFMDDFPSMIPPIPIIYGVKDVEFKILSQTSFRKHFDWFKSEFKV